MLPILLKARQYHYPLRRYLFVRAGGYAVCQLALLVAAVDEGCGLATPGTLPCAVACFLSDWLLRRYQIGSARQMRPLHFEFHWSYLP